jgi:hypothetical protein
VYVVCNTTQKTQILRNKAKELIKKKKKKLGHIALTWVEVHAKENFDETLFFFPPI